MVAKKSSKPAVPTAADFKVGDIVLTKLKGFPEWPGKIIDQETAPPQVQSARAGKHILVRFYPDADYVWAYPRELKQLTPKIIDAFLSEPSKKQGKLKHGYEIARDPSSWEAEQAEKDAAANEPEEEEEVADDVDMLAEDGEGAGAGKKRKRASASEGKAGAKAPKKKETASKGKKEPPAKKQKTTPAAKKPKAEKVEKAPKEKKEKPASATPAAAASGDDDTSEEAKTVKGWRATLQKAFLTKGVPSAEEMPKYDAAFSAMEKFEMQAQWLASSKLGKVLKKMAVLTEEIPREAEFKIKERSNALMEKWKNMLNAQPATSAPAAGEGATAAGDLTVVHEDGKKEDDQKMETDAAPEAAASAPAESAAPSASAESTEKKEDKPVTTNGVNGAVNAEGQTNGVPEPTPTEEKKTESTETPAAPKENGVVATGAPVTTA